jgi:carotenoid cleavage dioxygenase
MTFGETSENVNDFNPYIRGPYAPVIKEVTALDLKVTGEIPRDIHGGYYRNGPNPLARPTDMHHWFDSDGMLHGVYFENGKAEYRNRFIRTSDFEADRQGMLNKSGIMHPAIFDNSTTCFKDTANTDIICHNGELMALWYVSGQPVRLDPRTLETLRTETFGGKLPKNVSAHSKVDLNTGEFVFFDYQLYDPFYSFGIVSKNNELTHFTDIELPGPRLPHDMGLTENYAILMDLPVVMTDAAIKNKTWNIHFDPKLNTRFGVIPRNGQGTVIKWFEFSPCYIYHVVNAWEEGDEVVMYACKFVDNGRPLDRRFGPYATMVDVLALRAELACWRMNMKTGATKEYIVDQTISEFPVVNLSYTGRKTRYSYHATIPDTSTQLFDGLIKYDLETGSNETHKFPANCFGSEPAFVPRENPRSEDDGYVVTFITNAVEETSSLLILDAQNITAKPLAEVHIPQRVPLGFHGTWASHAEMNAA